MIIRSSPQIEEFVFDDNAEVISRGKDLFLSFAAIVAAQRRNLNIEQYLDDMRRAIAAEQIPEPPISDFFKLRKFPGFVYVLTCSIGTKIGITKNIKRRISHIQGSIPYPLTLFHSFHSQDCANDEAWLHRHFKSKRMKGEWFDLNEDDLAFILKTYPSQPITTSSEG